MHVMPCASHTSMKVKATYEESLQLWKERLPYVFARDYYTGLSCNQESCARRYERQLKRYYFHVKPMPERELQV